MEVMLLNEKHYHHAITTSHDDAIALYEKHRKTAIIANYEVSAAYDGEVFRYYDVSWRKES